jgi:beta-lactamase class A
VSALSQQQAQDAVAAVAAASRAHVGLAARHLGTGEELSWQPDARIQTASTVKVAIYAEVMRQARLGQVDLAARVTTGAADLTGGSGVLSLLQPGASCTVADLCTLMIIVSDNTATNMLIDLLGGVGAVNQGVSALGYPGIVLDHKVAMAPPPYVVTERPKPPSTTAPLATATPADLCRLAGDLAAGTVVDEEASREMLRTLRYQQSQSLFPRSFLGIADPFGEPGPQAPALAHKTGWTRSCRADTGVLSLPGDGGTIAYCAVADQLADQTMTALAEGEEIVGRLGAIVLARWWPGPGPVPVRPGWLPGAGA